MLAAVLFAGLLSMVLAYAADGSADLPAWSAPGSMAVRRVGSTVDAANSPIFFNNLDCSATTYRLAGSKEMLAGCFEQTAFGLFDSDHYKVIFNGSDEGLPLIPYTAHQLLAPWGRSMDLVSLEPVNNGGAIMALYSNPLAVMKDQHDLLGRVTAKQLVAAPDITLDDPSGKPLIVNPRTLAFSDGGSWLVVESLDGAFVRVNLATLAVTAFAPAYASPGNTGLRQSRVAVTEDGRFIAIANDDVGEFKVYDLSTCDGKTDGLKPQDCKSYDYHPFLSRNIGGLRAIRQVWFVNEGLLGFSALSDDHGADGDYELAPAGSITSLTDYIGLGDSYTSGEGAFDYIEGTDGPDNVCHLSVHSYPLLLSRDLFGRGGHSVACSGAVINDISRTDGGYAGQVKAGVGWRELEQSKPSFLESVETGFLPGYVAQHRFVKRWQPAIVTVSIGGNDIGFGDLLKNCVEPHISRHLSDNTCYNTYEQRLELTNLIDRTVPRWTALYKQLQRESPSTRLYAIGYPSIAVDNGNCALNVQLSKSELEFADETIDYLNRDIKKAAIAAGVTYVDISQALKGHRLCEAAGYAIAVNGLTAGNDAGPFGIGVLGRESYHPNVLGQELMEQSILRQTHNLKTPEPSQAAQDQADDGNAGGVQSASSSAKSLLDAPKTGGTVYALMPDDGLAPEAARRESSIPIRADGGRDGLRPGTPFSIRLDGPEGPVLGIVTSDSFGNLSGSVALPGGTAPGGHTLDAIGQGQDGGSTDVSQPLYVQANDHDADGDGIDNIMDTCSDAINSGQDSDHDGIDDICDSIIAATGAGTGSSGIAHAGTTRRPGRPLKPAKLAAGTSYAPRSLGASTTLHTERSDTPDSRAPRNVTWSVIRLFWLAIAATLLFLSFLASKFNKKVRFWLQ